MAEFTDFWSKYPRKIARAYAMKIWKRLTAAQQEQAVVAIDTHVKYWNALDTQTQYIPHASTWLHQERFEDELEMPKPKAEVIHGWWASEAATLQMAKQLGIFPRNGEGWNELRQRIKERLAA